MKNPLAGPGWLGPTAGAFAAAVAVSVLGGPLLLGLLAAVAVALLWHPLRRNPPWTRRGRLAWQQRAARTAAFARAASRLRRAVHPTGAPVVQVSFGYHRHDAQRFDAVIRVRCEIVSDRLQVWHASDTGRAYEVFTRDSYPDALPGDEGWLSFEGGRPRVRPIREVQPERLIN